MCICLADELVVWRTFLESILLALFFIMNYKCGGSTFFGAGSFYCLPSLKPGPVVAVLISLDPSLVDSCSDSVRTIFLLPIVSSS